MSRTSPMSCTIAASMPRSMHSPRYAGVGAARRLEQDVEREVDAGTPLVGDEAGLLELVERELGTVIARVEALAPR
jgi:hypothetical protein